MIHTNDPRQNRLFDPFEGMIPPAGRRIIGSGWQGVFRHVLLEVMPADELGQNFSQSLGAPTKELYSMAGLVFSTIGVSSRARRAANVVTAMPPALRMPSQQATVHGLLGERSSTRLPGTRPRSSVSTRATWLALACNSA